MGIRDAWYYFNSRSEQVGPITAEEVQTAVSAGELNEDDQVFNPSFGPDWNVAGVPVRALQKLEFEWDPDIDTFLAERVRHPMTVLAGPNNSGKSFALKFLCAAYGPGAYLLGCNRFYHADRLKASSVPQGAQIFGDFRRQFYSELRNTERNRLNLEQIVTGLSDTGRDQLFELTGRIIGAGFAIERVDPHNEFSERYVTIDGEELAVSSAGTRLLMMLLGACLHPSIEMLFIDEPELGLSPATQAAVAMMMSDPSTRTERFPHLKGIVLATHSHLFLDRGDLTNNFVTARDGSRVTFSRVDSIGAFQTLQFALLGNELEALYLPSAILIVEGPSDHEFLSAYLRLFEWGRNVAVVRGRGDGGVLGKINTLREALGDHARSPYRSRMVCVLDQRHSVRLDRIAAAGIPAERCLVWSKNGIEHYYPKDLLRRVFSCGDSELEAMELSDDGIEINGIFKTKVELARLVARRMTADSEFDEELDQLERILRQVCLPES